LLKLILIINHHCLVIIW